MRKFTAMLLCVLLICVLAAPVHAATGVSGGSFSAAVSSNGSCQVTLDLTLHLEGSAEDLVFPLPGNARSITINGKSAWASRSGDVMHVKLSSVLGDVTGDFPVRLQYTLPNLVQYNDAGKLILTLPILSGFSHTVSGLDFSISLPGDILFRPTFTSGYFQQVIESSLTSTVSGSSVSGSVNATLKDRETLTMTLEVTEDMFPQNPVKQWTVGLAEILMIVLASLAALYWILFMRSAPFISRRSTTAPEGYTGGELSGLLTGYGNDLTMMVFSWAQLGYILIQVQRGNRVTLHRQMDMGNERDPEEVRLFRSLFGRRHSVDGTGYHYATLCRKAAADPGNTRGLYKRSTGNPKVFRLLCALIGLLCGISTGTALAGDAVLGFLLVILMAILGGISAWIMQDWVKGLHLHNKPALWLGLGLAAAWCLLGIPAKILNVTACASAAQLLCGLASAYGGRRTILGRQTVSQMLALRRYLKTLTPEEADRIRRTDPDYFFNMAPHAMALGVLIPFAKSFRSRRLTPCPYLITGKDGSMNALEWAQAMEAAARNLDARQRKLFLERLTGR